MHNAYINSPIGILEIIASKNGICEINFIDEINGVNLNNKFDNKFIELCAKELKLYFDKKLKKFSVALDINGTEFEKSVYSELQKIEYGKTKSYKDIAKSIGNEKAYRAIGNANGKNKIPIILPCHRVLAANGLGGYSGGIDKKIFLLNLENAT